MSAHFERGSVLFGQKRFEEAVKELKLAVLDDSECPYTHGLLAIALGRLDRYEQAGEVATKVIQLAPDIAYSHYIRALVKMWRGDLAEARKSIEEAIRLDPEQPEHFGALARMEYESSRWAETVAAADRGLALDPAEDTCMHYRSLALAKLGRREEAEAGVSTLLANDPDDPHTHGARAWLYLESGDAAKAKTHFLEALRLDPTDENTRHGLAHALAARHFIFGKTLQALLYLERFKTSSLWLFLLAGLIGFRLLTQMARAYPDTYAIAFFIKATFYSLAVLMIVAQPLFDIVLRFDREGRLALTEGRLRAANLNSIIFFAALCFGVMWAWKGGMLTGGIAWATVVLPSAVWRAHLADSEWMRKRLMWVACGAALLIPFSFVLFVAAVVVMLKFKINTVWLITTATYIPLVSSLISAFIVDIEEYLQRKKPDDAD